MVTQHDMVSPKVVAQPFEMQREESKIMLYDVLSAVPLYFRFDYKDYKNLAEASPDLRHALREVPLKWELVSLREMNKCYTPVLETWQAYCRVQELVTTSRCVRSLDVYKNCLEKLTVGVHMDVSGLRKIEELLPDMIALRALRLLTDFSKPVNLDLATVSQLKTLHVSCNGFGEPRPADNRNDFMLRLQLTPTMNSKLTSVELSHVHLTNTDLSTLSQLKSVSFDKVISPKTLLPSTLEELSMQNCDLTALDRWSSTCWPKKLQKLTLIGMNIGSRELTLPKHLKYLTIDEPAVLRTKI